jgi:hypothetical protein
LTGGFKTVNRIPEAFRNYPQFVLYREADKIPFNPLLNIPPDKFNQFDPAHQMTAQQAIDAAKITPGSGIGFVFTENDPFFFLDIDKAVQPDNTWSPLATSLLQVFTPACYFESSISGTGCHIFGSYTTRPDHSSFNKPAKLEFYTKDRYAALTGNNASGCAGTIADDQIKWLVENYFKPRAQEDIAEWTTGPVTDYRGPEDDKELIAKMLESTSSAAVFGNKTSVKELWEGNTSQGRSEADAALCSHLAFWTGKDCERIDRLFRQSGLMRDKWDRPTAGSTYGKITLLKAVGLCKKVLGEGTQPDATPGNAREGFQLLTIDKQIEYFKHCVFDVKNSRIYTPAYGLLDQKTFKAVYGGYIFLLGNEYDSKTTTDAWKAFTESQGYNFPVVHGTVFRPTEPPHAIVYRNGKQYVNTFVPLDVPCAEGDVSPFTELLHKLLPVERDRQILLAYMAACVQYPGVKFQWCPLLQGAQGNGKTFLAETVAHAVGIEYTHSPNTKDIDNKFNAWIINKQFINVEEVSLSDRKDVMEVLKPMITNTRLEAQGKGTNQDMIENIANFFMCSNYKNAVRKTKDDRRYAVFFTAQQEAEDIIRDGMGGDYFPNLWNWARKEGYKYITHYLREYKIPNELNPAKSCHRAPDTSATMEAISESLTVREQEVLNAIAEGAHGFQGGWISTIALNRRFKNCGLRVAPNAVKNLMNEIGYVQHPNLLCGRVNNPIPTEDNKKPVLYIKKGHINANIEGGSNIAEAYIKAQASAPSIAQMVFQEKIKA